MTEIETPLAVAARGISKSFAGTRALRSVDLDVRRGEIHGLVGGNGSGKSTLIKSISGVYQADAGTFAVDGNEIQASDLRPSWARDVGVRVVHQDLGVFDDLTVAENLAIGHGFERGPVGNIRWKAVNERASALIQRFEIDASPHTPLARLSQSNRALVAIARALQDRDDAGGILILDEPTASLPGHEVRLLLKSLKRYAASGQAVLYVSHRLDEILDVTDRVSVMRDGERITTVATEALDQDELIRLIVGHSVQRASRSRAMDRAPGATPKLEFSGISVGPLQGADLSVHSGEVVGVAGLLGSGRSTLLKAAAGVVRPSGQMLTDGQRYDPNDLRSAMSQGFAYVPENRAKDAAFADQSVRDNLVAAKITSFWRRFGLSESAITAEARTLIKTFAVKTPSDRTLMSALSGGNQQKVVIARWLARSPGVLLLDEPTQGVDVGARAAIHALIRGAADQGAAVLLVASDFEELAEVCDRVVILRGGRISGEASGAALTAHALTAAVYDIEEGAFT